MGKPKPKKRCSGPEVWRETLLTRGRSFRDHRLRKASMSLGCVRALYVLLLSFAGLRRAATCDFSNASCCRAGNPSLPRSPERRCTCCAARLASERDRKEHSGSLKEISFALVGSLAGFTPSAARTFCEPCVPGKYKSAEGTIDLRGRDCCLVASTWTACLTMVLERWQASFLPRWG